MYIEKVPNRNSPPAVLLRETWREGNKTKKRTLANLSALSEHQIEAMRKILKNKTLVSPDELFTITESKSHGHVSAVITAFKQLKLPELIASQPSKERDCILALIAARILNPSSKLAVTRWWKTTTLTENYQLEDINEDDLYAALDWLCSRQEGIQEKLAKRHLAEGRLGLYDLSSSYVEGNCCPLAQFGYNRDKKKGKRQINYGLLANQEGCPVAIEVYSGETKDSKTFADQVEKVQKKFGIKSMVFVGDRGMITQADIEQIQQRPDLHFITALKSRQIRSLIEQTDLQMSLFDEQDLCEVTHPDYPNERIVLCRNPMLLEKRRHDREALIEKTREQLQKLKERVEVGRFKNGKNIALQVGKIINKFKVEKLFDVTIGDNNLNFNVNKEKQAAEEELDGLYAIRSDVPKKEFDDKELVWCYKDLMRVEQAFRNMKSMDLQIRPIYHYAVPRVKAHIFLCMLAYYVQWHMREAWRELLFCEEEVRDRESNPVKTKQPSPKAKEKATTKRLSDGTPVHSWRSLLTELSTVTRNYCQSNTSKNIQTNIVMDTKPNAAQQKAMDLLSKIVVPSKPA